MCGICGILMHNRNANAFEKAVSILIEQKHRGTAATGMAYFHNGNLTITKDIVAPDNFKGKHLNVGSVVIGHNRMPSQGANTVQNAHPFFACDGSFAMLHNGSENTGILKDFLIKLGHSFTGETDSEVLCHAIEEFSKTMGLKDAIMKVYKDCRFTTFLILTKGGDIYGIGDSAYIIRDENGIYIASEKDSFLPMFKGKRKVIYHSKDGGLFHIKGDGKMYFVGEFDKDKETIKESYESDDDGVYLGGHFWNRKKKEKNDDMDDEDVEEELEKVEAERMMKQGKFCECMESETEYQSFVCNKCGRYITEFVEEG